MTRVRGCVLTGDTLGSCMIIELESIPFDVLNSIIQFMYVGEFEVPRSSLGVVSAAAHVMQLHDLIILCDHVLKALKTSDNSTKSFLPKVTLFAIVNHLRSRKWLM